MRRMQRTAVWGYLGAGLLIGVLLSGFWPQSPLGATATDRSDSFAVATGAIDEDIEAIYFLDFLTGNLKAAVLGKQTGKFSAFFETPNVKADLGIDPASPVKFLMVTGVADLRRAPTRMQPSRSVVYVVEPASGKCAVYSVPWSSTISSSHQVVHQALVLLDVLSVRGGAMPVVTE